MSAIARTSTTEPASSAPHNPRSHTFDSFECAIHVLAPTCAHCGVKVIGHGLEAGETIYCCDHCAKAAGVTGLRDSL